MYYRAALYNSRKDLFLTNQIQNFKGFNNIIYTFKKNRTLSVWSLFIVHSGFSSVDSSIYKQNIWFHDKITRVSVFDAEMVFWIMLEFELDISRSDLVLI